MPKADLCFIENIIPIGESKSEQFIAVLLKASLNPNLKETEDNLDFIIAELNQNQVNSINQGQYIYYFKNELTNANTDKIAKRNIYYNNYLRGRISNKNLIREEEEEEEEEPISLDSITYSYHINVGHGNCSIIVSKESNGIKVYLIDCSNYDFIIKKSYQENIDKCLKHIAGKFSLSKITFDKCFITHPHFDHYSGLNKMISEKKINSKTIFYINLHYSMASENYNRLLKKINKLNATVVEPTARISNNQIKFLYPQKRTIRTETSKYSNQDILVESNPNNASTVIQFIIGNKSILFTGDIEKKGWNTISDCPTFLNESDYFIVSHHGSINGHQRTECPAGRNISNLSNCVKHNSKQIIMGRNNAYNGIYSAQVLTDFNNLIYSEKDANSNVSSFLEIDWKNNNANHYA